MDSCHNWRSRPKRKNSFPAEGNNLKDELKIREAARIWTPSTHTKIWILKGHTKRVNSVCFSSDGKWLVSGSSDCAWKVWDLRTRKELWTASTDSPVFSVALNPDNTRLATGSGDAFVRLWDVATKKVLLTLNPHSGPVKSVVFSPDGNHLASLSLPNWETARRAKAAIKIWDAASGQELWTVSLLERSTWSSNSLSSSSLAFSPDGKRLVGVGGEGQSVNLWDTKTGQETLPPLLPPLKPGKYVDSVAYSPDGKRIVTAGDSTVTLWDAGTGQKSWTKNISPGSSGWEVSSLAFSPDSTRIICGKLNGGPILDAATGDTICTLRVASNVAFSPDSARIASNNSLSDYANEINVWEAVQPPLSLEGFTGHKEVVNSVAFSPDGKRLVSGSGDKTVKVWDATTGQEVMTLTGHTGGIYKVSFNHDGTRIVSASKEVIVWDAATAQKKWTRIGGIVAFSPDLKWVAMVINGALQVCNMDTGQELHTFTLPKYFRTVAIIVNGKRVTSVIGETLKVWDSATGQEIHTFKPEPGIRCMAISADGKSIVTSSKTSVKVWDAETGQVTRSMMHTKEDFSFTPVVDISPDSKRVVFSGNECSVWDVATGQLAKTFHGELQGFSADWKQFVCNGGNISRVWDANTGEEFGLTGFRGFRILAFSPDGKRLANGGATSIKIWDLSSSY